MTHCSNLDCPICGETSERGRTGGNVLRTMAFMTPLGIVFWVAVLKLADVL